MANKKYQKIKPISIYNQKIRISQLYDNIIEKLYIEKSELVCIMKLQPAEDADTYIVKITYKLSDYSPKVWVISPEIKKFNGHNPHHIYGKDESGHFQLCVYTPQKKEWNQNMFIAESFIPWIVTWLNTYEYWVITGEWIFPETHSNNQEKKWKKQ